MHVPEFEAFRVELRALAELIQKPLTRTLRDDSLRERFRTLFRGWSSSVEPSLKRHISNTRDLFKLSGELEALARLSSKVKAISDYRNRLRTAIRLADSLVIYLPIVPSVRRESLPHELFLPAIPDLPIALVPNAILGWKSRMEVFVRDHPFEKSAFIMVRYRKRNQELIAAVKASLQTAGYFGILASEHNLTDDLYNPIACLLCCSQGIAVFDRAERDQAFNPNVAYELGMLHLLQRRCLILKHDSLRTLQTDILMKLYTTFSGPSDAADSTANWFRQTR